MSIPDHSEELELLLSQKSGFCQRFLHHTSSHSLYFKKSSASVHQVYTFAPSFRNEELDHLVELLSNFALAKKEVIYATDLDLTDTLNALFSYLSSFHRILPVKLKRHIYKESITLLNEKQVLSSPKFSQIVDTFTIQSCEPFKDLDDDAIIAYAISSSSEEFIRGPMSNKIIDQVKSIEQHVNNVHELLKDLDVKNAKDSMAILKQASLSIKSCVELLETPSVSKKFNITKRKSVFKVLSKLLTRLAISCMKLEFEQLQSKIHFMPLDLTISPLLQGIWADKCFALLLEQEHQRYHLYTDASIKYDHCGSISGVVTLPSGHIVCSWSYQLQEAITNSTMCELIAIVFALCQIKSITQQVLIQTDSETAISTLLKLLNKGELAWQFKKNPLLVDLIKLLPRQPNIKIQHVKGHANCSGNQFADRSACFAHIYGKELQWKAWALKMIQILRT